jgi:nifR3 family TIM-barrel protein
MSDVTDVVFRQIIAKYSKHGLPAQAGKLGGGPDVFFTEFVSADGIASKEGRKKLLPILKFTKKEKPIIAQIFGAKPENIKVTCEIISKLGFDGIDINMGCPDRTIIKQCAGSALINNPKLACEIIRAAKAGAPKMPISVKTRIGFNYIEYKKWLPKILSENISALTVHLRTKKEMSNVPAHFELAKDVVKIVRANDKNVVLIANGDIQDLEHGKKLAKEAGFDGVMIGRGIFGNPWFFDSKRKTPPTTEQKLKVLIEHTKLYEKLLHCRNYANMKKHFKAYVNGFDGAKELRTKLMETNNSRELVKVINNFLKK